MNDLLRLAVQAHGGLDRWSKVSGVRVAASVTGAIWHVKGKPDYLKDIVFEVDTHSERVVTDFPGQDKRSIFEPNRIVMERLDGRVIEERDDPEKSFEGHEKFTPWDDIHVAYFSGEAFYTYFNTPFLYTYPGFTSEEIDPIQVHGETWRRLRVSFPDSVKSHHKSQISCFGSDGLLRRHDYTVDILGGASGLNYAFDYRDVDGILFPTERRVYAWEGDYQIVKEPLLVDIKISDITVR